MNELGCKAYLETSAKTRENLDEVFETAIDVVIKNREGDDDADDDKKGKGKEGKKGKKKKACTIL